jgi:hypothetical protein
MRKKIIVLSQLIMLFLMLYSFNINADDLKVLYKIEFNKKASKKLISTLVKDAYNDSAPKEVYYEKFDLNNDKSKEYFLYYADSGWCSSAGCKILILSKYGSKKNLLLGISGGEVYVLNHKTQKYYDILIKGGRGDYIFYWNGSYYQTEHTIK